MWSGQKARLIALDARRGRNHDRPGNCCGGRAASLDTLRWLRRRWAGGWLPVGASLDYVGAGSGSATRFSEKWRGCHTAGFLKEPPCDESNIRFNFTDTLKTRHGDEAPF
jgi:hypothetical protein